MASSRFLKFVCLVLVCMMIGAPKTRADITCNQVVASLLPCVNYIRNGGSVPQNCCGGIQNLYNAARATADRQAVCNCVKQAVNGIPYNAFNLGNAASLPGKCGVNVPYKISPSVNCAGIK